MSIRRCSFFPSNWDLYSFSYMFWNMSSKRPSSVLRIVFFVLRSKCKDLLSASLKLACPNISVFAPLLRPWNCKSQYAQTRRAPASPACQDLWLHSPWLDIDLQTTNDHWFFQARNQFKTRLKNPKIVAYNPHPSTSYNIPTLCTELV